MVTGLRNMFKFWIALFLVLSVAKTGFGSASSNLEGPGEPIPNQSLKFKRLTLKDGLSQSSINCITQDQQGFMWFGTQDGLNRYDGYTFKVYRSEPDNPHSLSYNYVAHCYLDQRNVLWVLTQDRVLHRYDPRTDGFHRYTLKLENPLNQTLFSYLLDDRQGRLWVGNHGGGIARYDPDKDAFTYYRHDPNDPHSLGSNFVQTFYEDHDGTIWIGTHAGLNRYDPATDQFVRYPYRAYPSDAFILDPIHEYDPAFAPNDPYALSAPSASVIYEDSAGNLWVGTWYGGLNKLDRSTGRFTHYPFVHSDSPFNQTQCDANVPANQFTGNSVSLIQEDRLGRLWIVLIHRPPGFSPFEYSRLHRLDPKTGEVVRYCHYDSDPSSLPYPPAVRRIFKDQAGDLWFHTFGGGVDIWDEESNGFVHYRHDPQDSNTLSDDGVMAFYQDRAGGVWIGTETNGVNLYDPSWAKFAHYLLPAVPDERSSNNSILRIYGDPDSLDAKGQFQVLWVSTFAGLNRWDRRTGTFTFSQVLPHVPDVTVYDMLKEPSGTLWLATGVGLYKSATPITQDLDLKTMTFTGVITRSGPLSGQVTAVRPDPGGSGNLWVGINGIGLVSFDPVAEQIRKTFSHDPGNPNSLSRNEIAHVIEGQDKAFWIVTQAGLDHFDPATETFVHYPYDIQRGSILAVYENRAGVVWVGTLNSGLQHLNRATGTWTDGRQAYRLPYNTVYGILPDPAGNLWLSTNNGLIKFNPDTKATRVYTWRDGLQSDEFNSLAFYQAPNGEMFFGGVNGLNAFYPDRIKDNPYAPPIVLTALTQGTEKLTLDQTVESLDQVTLRWPDNSFEFEFAALSFAQPDRNQYAYRLEGFDKDWNTIGTRHFGRYTNLPGGTYTLRLKGANHDGVWNEQGASIQVTIVPPVWETWWFRGAAVMLVGLAVFTGYRLRVRSIQAHNMKLERQVSERTQEIERLFEQTKELAIVEERNRLARDLHDSAKQKAFAALAQLGAARGTIKKNPGAARKHLDEAENLVYEVIQELTFLIQEMYPMALKEKGLVTVLREYIYEWESRTDIQVALNVTEDRRLPLQIEQALYRVAQESLANVSRHSRASQVEICLDYTDSRVDLTIVDNGNGFELAQKPAGVGLRSMRERTATINGQIEIESAPGRGARIHVRAPVNLQPPTSNGSNGNGSSHHRPDRR
jgi:signal transduction histidine kinase/ligand-binding sensor domain-containing protein